MTAGELSANAACILVVPSRDPERLAAIEQRLNTCTDDGQPLTCRTIQAAVRGGDGGIPRGLTADAGDGYRPALARQISRDQTNVSRQLARRDLDTPATEDDIAAWKTRWLEELFSKLMEDRGIPALLTALGVKLAKVWGEELAGPAYSADYFNLHSKPQLIELAAELKVRIDEKKDKATIVRQLIMSPNTKKRLPAELAG